MKNREAEIDAQIKILSEEKEKIRRNKLWHCPFCKKKTMIKNLSLVMHYKYHYEDYDPTGLISITCPKCSKLSNGYCTDNNWEKFYNLQLYFRNVKRISE